jgi:hypothetical protein
MPAGGGERDISAATSGGTGHPLAPAGGPHDRNVIWFTHPPKDGWLEGLPIGNGRIGGMVLGFPLRERIGLNHDRLWRKYHSYRNFDTASVMPECRRLCLEKKWDEAQALLLSKLPDHGTAHDVFINPFVPVGDLGIYPVSEGSGEVTDFERRLDLDTGVVEVVYTLDSVQYRREALVSWSAQVLVVHLTAGKAGKLSAEVTLSRLLDPNCTVTGGARLDELVMEGMFGDGVRFASVLRVIGKGGRLVDGQQTYRPPQGVMPPKEPIRFMVVARGGEPRAIRQVSLHATNRPMKCCCPWQSRQMMNPIRSGRLVPTAPEFRTRRLRETPGRPHSGSSAVLPSSAA